MTACIDCGPAPQSTELPRSKWTGHPHHPSQLLLVQSHEGFRSISKHLVDLARRMTAPNAPSRPTWRADAEWSFIRWHQSMARHEAYEEGKLYPFLARRFGVSMTHLAEDHRTLHVLRDAVRAAFDADEGVDVEAALSTYHEALLAHLEREEDAVIPLLLALSPDEFRHYLDTSIQSLLAELGTCEPAVP